MSQSTEGIILMTAGGGGGDDCAIWEATQRLGLFRMADAELETLIQHPDSPRPDARLAAEAARYVRQLRNEMARGDAY
jgi:hypothetical protein